MLGATYRAVLPPGRKRTIGIDEATAAVLTNHRWAQRDECDKLGDFWRRTPDGLVLTVAEAMS